MAKRERINTRTGEKRAGKREGERENVKEKEGQVEQQGSKLPYVDVQLRCRLFKGVFYGKIGEMRSNRDRYI